LLIQVSTGTQNTIQAYVDASPDGTQKCITVKIMGEQTKIDTVSACSLIIGLEALVAEVEKRNDEN
jgi:hypothetical protein